MSQVMFCRSLKRSRSSHSLSSYSTAASRLLLPSRLSYRSPSHSWMLLCSTTPPCDVSQDVSRQTSDQPVSSISFDVAVQTSFHSVHTSSLDAAVQTIPHSTLSQDVSTQVGSRSASSFSVDMFAQTPIRSTVLHDVATQLPLTEFFLGCIFSNDPLGPPKL